MIILCCNFVINIATVAIILWYINMSSNTLHTLNLHNMYVKFSRLKKEMYKTLSSSNSWLILVIVRFLFCFVFFCFVVTL